MRDYVLPRDNNVDLGFTGQLLSDTSSETSETDRWTEIRLYRTNTGKYIIETVGQSRIPGEVPRPRANVVDSAEALLRSLRRKSGDTVYLTHLARKALTEAAWEDDDIDRILVENV